MEYSIAEKSRAIIRRLIEVFVCSINDADTSGISGLGTPVRFGRLKHALSIESKSGRGFAVAVD